MLRWQRLEAAKHCLIHGLLRLGVPFVSRFDDRQGARLGFKRHHAEGPPPDWQERFVSRYASGHPWEDFAETWAHHLHIVDTLETASAFGLSVHPKAGRDPALTTDIDFGRPTPMPDRRLAATYGEQPEPEHGPARPLSVRADPVIDKLRFVHGLIRPNHA